VAVVGASADTSKWGGDVAARLARAATGRPVHFVNRRGGEMHGRPVYRSLTEIPEVPELAVVATPAAAFDGVLDEALGIGVKAFVGIFAGLGESGPEGRARERDAVRRIRAAGAMLLGPNCMGLADHSTGFEAVAYLDIPRGDIGFLSQSGAMGEEFVMRSARWGCGFSRYVTLGNQADVSAAEILAAFAAHDETRVVAAYAESFAGGRELVRAAADVVASGRPLVVLSPGGSEAGSRAALSHTGSLAPDSAVVDAFCRASGAHRADTPRELFELAVALRLPARPAGHRIAVVSDGGGPGGIAADALSAVGLSVPEFGSALVTRVREALPGSAGANPVDFALGTIEPDGYARVAPVVAASGEVDAVFAVGQLGYWSARFPQFAELVAAEAEAAATLAESAAAGVPLVVATVYPESAPAGVLRSGGVPVYREIASGVAALAALAADRSGGPRGVPDLPAARPLVGRNPGYATARELMAAAGVPFVAARTAAGPAEARAAAVGLGFPVVVKALGSLHKSDAGGVALGLADPGAVERAAEDMQRRLDPPGFIVETEAPLGDGVELIVGCRRDAHLGPVVVIGMGGVFAEILSDVRTALAPLSRETALEMLGELHGSGLLGAVRGRPSLDTGAAAAAAVALSRFAAAHPEVAEAEINPLLVLSDRALALDARIIVAGDAGDAGEAGDAGRPGVREREERR